MMLLVGLFLSLGMALAQTQVNGTVTSGEDGEPVIGASILVVGTKTGAVTDIDGNFSLTCPAGSTLRISYLGMREVEVKAGKNLRISLKNDNKTLDEVMVVAFGQQSRASFAGSAAVVDSKDLANKVATNVADALVGSVPGLQLTGASGQPGAEQGDIHIRGIASLYSSTTPLIVVDGAPFEGSLSNLPQDDIEQVTVLKDASSAALYGARGAAGVILITTKSGSASKSHVTFEAKWGATTRSVQDYETITDPARFMETYYSQFYNYARYGNGMSNADANQWVNDRMITNQNYGLQYNPFTVPSGQNLIGLDGKINPNATLGRAYQNEGETYYVLPDNWKDAAYRTGNRQEYNVNLSGGSQKGSYYSSVSYLNEDGVIYNSGYERVTARLKADYMIKPWLKVMTNMNYTHYNQESNPNLSNDTSGSNNLGYYTQYIAPIYPLYVRTVDASGNPVIRTDSYGHQQYDYGVPSSNFAGQGTRLFLATGNPIGSNQYNEVTTTGNMFSAQLNFDVMFTDWLKFSSVNSVNFMNRYYSDYENPYYGPKAAENGSIVKYSFNTFRQNYSQTLNAHKAFGLHDAQLTVGHEWYKYRRQYLEADARGGFSPEVKEINAFSNRYDSDSYTRDYNVEGYFVNALYNYDEKYFLNASYRRDATSRFAKENRWGDFWSVGGAWILSKENFFQNLNAKWVDVLKLKASIGQLGNDGIPDFQYVERYELTKGENGMLPSFSGIGNKDITWETVTNFNLGVEFGFLNRINGEFNFYSKKTTDLLFYMSIPESYGARGYYGNMGDIRNTGFEFNVGVDVIKTKNILWNVAANLSHNVTNILSLPETKTSNYGGFAESKNDLRLWYAVDKPLYNAMLPEYAGVNENGEALYWVDEDIKAAGISNTAKAASKHSYTTTDWTEASYYDQGSILPKVSGGFSTSLKVYDFDLSAVFDYQLGGKVYDHAYQSLMGNVVTTGNGYTYSTDINKSWTPNNTSSNIPRFQYGDLYTNATSTRFLTSASYLNFQSFTVGYNVPRNLLSKLSISSLRVYVQGENLAFWSARKGLDPRFNFTGTGLSGLNTYSPVRTIMGGLKVTF